MERRGSQGRGVRLGLLAAIAALGLVAVCLVSPAASGVLRSAVGATLLRSETPSAPSGPAPTPAEAAGLFVQRTGASLTLGGAPYRFSGTNMYWLELDDNVRDAGGPTYPTQYRIDDAMTTAQAMGITVVRAWANSVGCARCIEPNLGQFNPDAFQALDHAVASAKAHGVRLELSLANNWDYYHGSKLTYTRWRGLDEESFFTNPTVIGDYQAFITTVLTHVNPVTGLAYKDDPTILGWATGNEMYCQTCAGNPWFPSWTQAVADHIKSVAPRQLVVDGHGTDISCTSACLNLPSLDIASVDIVDDHQYPPSVARLTDSVALARAHGKAYQVGEYNWLDTGGSDTLPQFLAAVESSGAAGDLFWGVFPHADTTGFVDHNDGFQYFYPGRDGDQRARTAQLVDHASRMSRSSTPVPVLGSPLLTGATATGAGVDLTFRGVAAADTYTVQRSRDGASWTTVSTGVTDQQALHGPTTADATRGAAAGARYRVQAVALDGLPGPWSDTLTAT